MSRPYPPRPSTEGIRRNGASIVIALLAHAVVFLMVVQAILEPSRVMGWIGIANPVDRSERIVYVQPLPSQPIAVGVPGASPRADDADPSDTELSEAAPPLVAPQAIPAGTLDLDPGATGAPPGSVPEGIRRDASTRGLVPSYTDPRLWGELPAPAGARPTTTETIGSRVVRDLRSYQDSLYRATEARQPGDWTIGRDGQKWGMDPGAIRLGRAFVPITVLLQGNPIAQERDRSIGEVRRQIDAVDRMRKTNAHLRSQIDEIRSRIDGERELRRQREDVRSVLPVASEPPG